MWAGIIYGLIPAELQKDYRQPATRAKIAQLVINLLELSADKDIDAILKEKGKTINADAFSDTSDKNILAANALGILNGTGDGKFSPDTQLSRAEFAAVISRVAGVLNYRLDGYPEVIFTDVQSHWVKDELPFSVFARIFNGTGNNKFSPSSPLTVQELGVAAVRSFWFFYSDWP